MQIVVWAIGKTTPVYLVAGVETYAKRLDRYFPFTFSILPDVKNKGKLPSDKLRTAEADLVLKKLKPEDDLWLLDERGREFSSVQLSEWLNKQLQYGHGRLIFLIGGAYGFDKKLYDRAKGKISLSKMTFSHQMVRLFWLEQLYRAGTILRHEPYHNEG